jgi:uncharacterized protein YwgA
MLKLILPRLGMHSQKFKTIEEKNMGSHGFNHGFITLLSGKIKIMAINPGMTIFQKIIYLLQELYNVPLRYEFDLHHHGPYSDDLARDIQDTAIAGGVTMEAVAWPGYNGYLITPGPKFDEVVRKSYWDILDAAMIDCKDFNRRDLEIISTIVFIEKNTEDNSKTISMMENVRPNFTRQEICNALDFVRRRK